MEISKNHFTLENGSGENMFWNFQGEFPFVDEWFLMSTPFPLIFICSTYLYFVMKLGPDLMKSRKPYSLNTVITIYNITQVIASGYTFVLALQLLLTNGLIYPTCFHETKESKLMLTRAIYSYLCCKLTELLDTFFFVLRKKQSQVSFLHVYHHTFMLCCTWLVLKYEPVYMIVFIGVMNCFVHIIMYSYYCLSAFPNMIKYLWWKKYLTKLQLIQFIICIIYFCVSHTISQCKASYVLLSAILFNGFLFIYLFAKFYVDTYVNKRNKIKNIKGVERRQQRKH